MKNFIHANLSKLLILLLSFTFSLSETTAQLVTTPESDPQTLIDELLGTGVIVSNIQVNCADGAIGTFDGTSSNIGINQGIMLTTGQVSNAVGPNDTPDFGIDNGFPGDTDLESITGEPSFDACVLEFDFIPFSDNLTFNYVFGSEEYLEFVDQFNDVFAFLISGPGFPIPTNIALIPGTAQAVTINNLNDMDNSQFFIDNGDGISPSPNSTVQYDGFTTTLSVNVTVVPCETYRLKLAIADTSDGVLDSGVFLETNSLGTDVVFGEPMPVCSPGGTFVLEFPFNSLGDGSTYTITESDGGLGVSDVTFTDDGTLSTVSVGPYPPISSWNVGITSTALCDINLPFSGMFDCCLGTLCTVVACAPDADVTCSADIVADVTAVEFDDCGLIVDVTAAAPVHDAGNSACGESVGDIYTIEYTVMAECGSTAVCTQTFTITNQPTITCPANTTVACAANIIPGIADFQTNCDVGGSVAVSGPVMDGEPNCPNTTYTYTFTGTDECGQQATCTQVFTIANDEPTISCMPNITVTCPAKIIVGTASFNTSCQLGGSVAVTGPVLDGPSNCDGTTYTYTFTGTDACGRTAECERVFTISNSGPTITCPPSEIVTCEDEIIVGDLPVYNTDCFIGANLSRTGPFLDGIENCGGTNYTYTYTVVDACGRETSCDQVFTIENDGPTITCPASDIVECFADISVDAADASFTTSCDLGATVRVSDPLVVGTPDCPGTTYTYTYTVEDECGRIATCDQVFTIQNAAPTITCPADATVECFADISVDAADATFTTSCNLGADVRVDGPVMDGDADCPDTTYTYTYTVTDACGRTATCDQVFTIENAGPTINCPANQTVQCAANIFVNVNNATFTTSCDLGGVLSLSGPVIVGAADCPGTTHTYTYTVTDDCGRTASCDQIFTIDNPGPTITCPEDCPVACASDIRPGTPEFTTSCNLGATLSMTGPAIDGDPGCNGTTYTYTHTVTDDCGRTASCDQVFTIVNECHLIDFDFDDAGNPLHPGTDMSDQYDDFTITTEGHYCAQLFDTGHPTSHDFDLGTPNEQYGGPGIGAGGDNNTEFQGNALIVSYDCGVPNEKEGKLIFTFACSVTIKTVDLLDMKCGESEVELYDKHGNQIAYLDIPAYGVNSFNTFDVNVSGVYTMIIDLDCGGGVTGFKYCKDNAPGTDCEAPDLCEDYNLDFDNSGYHWTTNSTSGSYDVGDQNYTIDILDDDDILENTYEHGGGLTIGINPHDVHDEVVISYSLSQVSDNVSFDIHDLDRKNYYNSKQQEKVCVYGLLGDDLTQILPIVTSLDGHVDINGNCAEGTTDSAHSHDDESVLVEFDECIDKVVIVYGTGSNSPTHNPSYSKITIGKRLGFNSEVCPEDCVDCSIAGTGVGGDDDGDGICNIDDVCPGGNDNFDRDGDGIPDACDDICYDYNIDHGDCGAGWGHDDTSGSVELGLDNIDITILDDDNIFVDSEADGAGLQVGIDPHDVDDELVVCYNLSKSSSNVVFDITDLDFKNSGSKQQEKVCVYGTLGTNQTPIFPTVSSLDGHVNVTDNCGEGTTDSAHSHDDESILVEFTECIDKITIVYGTGSNSPTHNPSYSKITIGASVFTVEQCKDACDEPCTTAGSGADNDGDGVCDDEDRCPGFDDNIDVDNDGIPDGCDGSIPREDESNADISLYPNPVYGSSNVTMEIDTETHGDAQIVIMDALGRVVDVHNIGLAGTATLHEVSTTQLTSGVYFVQLQTQEWRTDGMKLVVVKP